MENVSELETTFNTVYSEYDKWRPTYVKELYDDIFAAKEIDASSNVLKIGIGTGQATLPFLEKGCALSAIELGSELAQYVKQKYLDYSRFDVINTAFQDYECRPNSFDLVFSATAFHWIPEEIGYPKVHEILKSGGVFARFANHPYKDKGREALHQAIQKLYSVYMPRVAEHKEYCEDDARKLAETASKYGFVNSTYHLYRRTRTFTAKEYTCLLGTYSDHIAIEERTRKKFFAEIEGVINDFSGEITVYDTLDLQLARKP